jgi:hypothetical protein
MVSVSLMSAVSHTRVRLSKLNTTRILAISESASLPVDQDLALLQLLNCDVDLVVQTKAA